jgi:hypothetical protein
MGLPTSVPPDERYQCYTRDDGRNTEHKTRKCRATTEVFGIFAARRDDDKEGRLCGVELLVKGQ